MTFLLTIATDWIGTKFLLVTNRKLHTHFQLVPKATTLDDLERPPCTLFQHTSVSREVLHEYEKNITARAVSIRQDNFIGVEMIVDLTFDEC